MGPQRPVPSPDRRLFYVPPWCLKIKSSWKVDAWKLNPLSSIPEGGEERKDGDAELAGTRNQDEPWLSGKRPENYGNDSGRTREVRQASRKRWQSWFSTPVKHTILADLYWYLYPLYNCFYPSLKLIEKVKRKDGRYWKVYERLLECKAKLLRRKALYKPVLLNCRLKEVEE